MYINSHQNPTFCDLTNASLLDMSESGDIKYAVEAKSVLVTAPTLNDLGRDNIYGFLKRYNKYRKLREQDKKAALKLKECVDDAVLEQIALRHKDVVDDDEKLLAFLTSSCSYTNVEEVLAAWKQLAMDMRCADVKERLAKYEREFYAIVKRAESLKIKPKTTMEAYVEGIRPAVVQSILRNSLELETMDLQQLIKMAEDSLVMHDRMYMVEHQFQKLEVKSSKGKQRAPNERVSTSAGRKGNNLCRHCKKEIWSSEHAKVCAALAEKGKEKKEDSDSMCRLCLKDGKRVKYSIEHYRECIKAHQASSSTPQTKRTETVHAVTSTDTLLSQTPINSPKSQIVPIKIRNKSVSSMWDTCASVSVISEAMLEEVMQLTPVQIGKITRDGPLEAAGEQALPCNRKAKFTITAPTRKGIAESVERQWSFNVIAGKKQTLILGCDILRALGIIDDKSVFIPLAQADDPTIVDDDIDDSVLYISDEPIFVTPATV